MRRFSSYGPVDTDLHYYVPRQELVDRACAELLGEDPTKGGHYITVWAPRQRGKTWVFQQAVERIRARGDFEVALLTMQPAETETTAERTLDVLARGLRFALGREFPELAAWRDLENLFTSAYFSRPVILVLDEFDAVGEPFIGHFISQFRTFYSRRATEANRESGQKSCLLHGLALVGVRGVLGAEHARGSPGSTSLTTSFNVQRGLHIPNLTFPEVESMFRWYERESGQPVEQAVIERVYAETRGQPGLTSWLGELLTETYNVHPDQPLDLSVFEQAYGAAISVLPNSNILNIISKARQEPYRGLVLDLFKTDRKIPFRYDEPSWNFLYLNGVIDWEQEDADAYSAQFVCPFVQKRLFNYFAGELVADVGPPYSPLEDLDAVITTERVQVANLLRRFERYLHENRDWLLKDAPRKSNPSTSSGQVLRPYEAVFHFILYRYLADFLQSYRGRVWPEFPTGNGKVDPSTGSGQALLMAYGGMVYGLEVKSFTNRSAELTAKPAGLPAVAAPGCSLRPAVGACPERSRRAGGDHVGVLRGAGGRRQPDEV